jgi:chloramphenicol-sensitive protein RarD
MLERPITNLPGLTAGVACYCIWGFIPLVFQAIGARGVDPWEILAHRTLWSGPVALCLVILAGQWPQVARVFREGRTLGWLALSAMLLAANWIVFIYATNSGRLLEASFGYFVIPLINMAAGALIFREQIGRAGAVAIGLASAGVALQALAIGSLPVVSLVLALSFGAYGIVRKRVPADAQTGLFVECSLLGLPGLLYIVWIEQHGAGHMSQSLPTAIWLLAIGPITAIPLALFAWAARRLPLSVLGFLNFLAPTITFILGVIQGEAFTPLRALSFGFIWLGGLLFAVSAWRRARTSLQPNTVSTQGG